MKYQYYLRKKGQLKICINLGHFVFLPEKISAGKLRAY
jgi:hypothetical protein